MALNVTVEPKENRQLIMTIQVEQARVDQELRKAARKVARDYRVPGFRPGKAPYSILVQHVGLPTLFNEFIEPLGEELYKAALEQEGIEPYAQAALDVSGLEPLTYELTIPLEPEIDLGDYRSLRVEQKPVEVEESDIDAELEKMRAEYAEWKDLDRPSAWGDTLVIDVKSVIPASSETGEEEAGEEETVVLDETEWEVTLDEENPLEPAGFDAELLGLSAGDEKEFALSWPEDSRSIYKGKQAQFSVKVHKVQGEDLPALDDEFAGMVGPDFETLEDLRNHVRETLQDGRAEEAEDEYLTAALDKLVEQSKLDYPPAVVEDQIDSMVSEFGNQLRQFGIESVESFLARSGQTMEEYREGLREQAEKSARRALVISELYRVEGIEVTDEDIEARVQLMLGGPGGQAQGNDEFDDADFVAEDNADVGAEGDADVDAEGDAEVDAEVDVDGEATSDAEPTLEATDAPADVTADVTADETVDVTADEIADESTEVEDESDADRDLRQEAFRDLMLRGPGRQILESQILQQKALDRLRAIALGEELPPVPVKQEKDAVAEATEEAPELAGSSESETSDTATSDSETPESEKPESANS